MKFCRRWILLLTILGLLLGASTKGIQLWSAIREALGLSARTARPVSAADLAQMVAGKTSHFPLDLTVNRFDGGHYTIGEPITMRVVSGRAGHLYLLHIDPEGVPGLLFPRAGQSNAIRADEPFDVGADTERAAVRVAGPVGRHRIHAIVTTEPITVVGLAPAGNVAGRLEFLWDREDRQLVMRLCNGQAAPQSPPAIGTFAQDEAQYYVSE